MADHVRRSGRLRWGMAGALAVSGVALGISAIQPSAAQAAPRVILYGDSLSAQSGPYILQDLTAHGQARAQVDAWAGTAPCNWLPQMLEDARTKPMAAAMIEFSGNNFGCMDYPANSQAFYNAYRQQVTEAVRSFVARGIHVFLIGYPLSLKAVHEANTQWDRLNEIYAEMATTIPDTTYVNAGAAIAPNGQFTWTLPCRPVEPSCAPDDQVIVRADDGTHFCPQQAGNGSQCLDYSSGASRFAGAMTAPVHQFLAGEPVGTYVGAPLPAPNTTPIMASGQSATPYASTNDALTPGQILAANQSIESLSGHFRATLEPSGNLVISGASGPVWSSQTAGSGANALAMQPNGNVVLYAGIRPVWSTNTAGTEANYLGLQDNGQLALYNFNTLYWRTPAAASTTNAP